MQLNTKYHINFLSYTILSNESELASIGGRRKEEGGSEMQHPFRKLVLECHISCFLILEHNLTWVCHSLILGEMSQD